MAVIKLWGKNRLSGFPGTAAKAAFKPDSLESYALQRILGRL